MKCPNCNSGRVRQKLIAENGAELPIRCCEACAEEWEDADTFLARDNNLAERMRQEMAIKDKTA